MSYNFYDVFSSLQEGLAGPRAPVVEVTESDWRNQTVRAERYARAWAVAELVSRLQAAESEQLVRTLQAIVGKHMPLADGRTPLIVHSNWEAVRQRMLSAEKPDAWLANGDIAAVQKALVQELGLDRKFWPSLSLAETPTLQGLEDALQSSGYVRDRQRVRAEVSQRKVQELEEEVTRLKAQLDEVIPAMGLGRRQLVRLQAQSRFQEVALLALNPKAAQWARQASQDSLACIARWGTSLKRPAAEILSNGLRHVSSDFASLYRFAPTGGVWKMHNPLDVPQEFFREMQREAQAHIQGELMQPTIPPDPPRVQMVPGVRVVAEQNPYLRALVDASLGMDLLDDLCYRPLAAVPQPQPQPQPTDGDAGTRQDALGCGTVAEELDASTPNACEVLVCAGASHEGGGETSLAERVSDRAVGASDAPECGGRLQGEEHA